MQRFLFFIFLLIDFGLTAHPMPHSVLLLDVGESGIVAELQWPLKELQLAVPGKDIELHPQTLLQREGLWLDQYLSEHMRFTDSSGKVWSITILNKKVSESEQDMTGRYYELVFTLWLQPPPGTSPRHFILFYSAIMHQLVTHKLYLKIRQDWDGGLTEKDSQDADLGVLMMNMRDNTIPPVVVNLDEGSRWKGFKSMVLLGARHISEGTDHLLFLLVLMLPAPLLAQNRKWAKSGGTKYSLIHLLKIATAFTIGHSLTLLIGALDWVLLPTQPVEILIACSILIGAIHAFRPIFPGREIYVALGFGLVHGLAFASTLSGLSLDAVRMGLSILGFNLGIELMQLVVILLFVPWLIILSPFSIYRWVRIPAASFALLASLAWIWERVSGSPNQMAFVVQRAANQGHWLALGLALLAMSTYWFRKEALVKVDL